MNSAYAAKAAYSHRHNADHTFDSICHRCFRTIATEASEAALGAHELQHNCVMFAKNDTAAVNTPCVATGRAG